MRTSCGSSRSGIARISSSAGRRVGTSFMLCTARSISPRNKASSISLMNSPLPPMVASGVSRILSPVVLIRLSDTARAGSSSRRRAYTHSACQRASLLPRVPITTSRTACVTEGVSASLLPTWELLRSLLLARLRLGDPLQLLLEVEEPLRGLRKEGAIGGIGFGLEGNERAVQKFVRDRGRKFFDQFPLPGGQRPQLGQDPVDLLPEDAVGFAAQRHNGRHDLQRLQPGHHRRHLHPDDVFSLERLQPALLQVRHEDRKSTRLNSSHLVISYAVFCLKKKKNTINS